MAGVIRRVDFPDGIFNPGLGRVELPDRIFDPEPGFGLGALIKEVAEGPDLGGSGVGEEVLGRLGKQTVDRRWACVQCAIGDEQAAGGPAGIPPVVRAAAMGRPLLAQG